MKEMEKRDKEKKEELNKVNRDNLELSYQIEEAETEITKLKAQIAKREREKEDKAIGEDSFIRDLEKNFCNVGNMGFQAVSPRFRQRRVDSSNIGAVGARSLSGQKQSSSLGKSSSMK